MLFAMERFDMYIYGRPIHVHSDHQPLQTIVRKPLAAAPKRLQRMLLRMQRYDFTLQYKKGSELYLADTLSRLHPSSTDKDSVASVPLSPFEKSLETICSLEDVPLHADMQIERIATATEADAPLQTVKQLIQQGWPHQKQQVPLEARPYFDCRYELVVEQGIILRGLRDVIPQALRREILKWLHSSHMGVDSTVRRARTSIYWPGMNAEVRDFIGKCDACHTFMAAQQKEPLLVHDVPERPWSKVGSDLCEFEGREYLVTVDYTTNYWELDYLGSDTTSVNVINKLRAQFARHGVPTEVCTDNGPQFSSQMFAQFAEIWGFRHATSSPRYPQSNGRAESAVKMAKSLMRKAVHANQDAWIAILEYRNTPVQSRGVSPVKQFFGHATRTHLPLRHVWLWHPTRQGLSRGLTIRPCRQAIMMCIRKLCQSSKREML